MVIKIAGGPVEWRSHLQETTADSSNAAEYVALWEAAKAILGVSNTLQELKLTTTLPKLYEDNIGALRLANAGMGQGRARHLLCKYHAVQDWTGQKRLQIEYVPTTRQIADALTKGGHADSTLRQLVAGMGLVTDVPHCPEGSPIRGSAQGGTTGTTRTTRTNETIEGPNKAATVAQPVRCKPTTRPHFLVHQGEYPNEERRSGSQDVNSPRRQDRRC